MKFSIIIAFLHMMLGLACSGLNYLYAGNRAGLIGKFIPQVLFLSSIFGYLCLLVLYKWTHTWET
jgi:V-type H+-transporting ATPase subunit a